MRTEWEEQAEYLNLLVVERRCGWSSHVVCLSDNCGVLEEVALTRELGAELVVGEASIDDADIYASAPDTELGALVGGEALDEANVGEVDRGHLDELVEGVDPAAPVADMMSEEKMECEKRRRTWKPRL